MAGLLSELLSGAKKVEIGYGIHEPVVILSVSNKVKKNKDGVALKRNNYTLFGKLDKDGEITAEKEISWFDINTEADYAYDNFFTQLEQMVGILDCYYDESEEDIVGDTIDKFFEDEELETKEDLRTAVSNKKSCTAIIEGISAIYEKLLKDKIGKDSKHIRLKLCFDSKGKYLQQPKFDIFTEPLSVPKSESRLKLTAAEEEYRIKSENLIAPSKTPANI